MGRVVEFPIKKKAAETILARLNARAENLEEKYVVLDKIHAELHKAEEEADCMESRYNEVMLEYAKLVGTENIPKDLLEYASNCRIDVNADTAEYILTFANEIADAPAQFTLDLLGEEDEKED